MAIDRGKDPGVDGWGGTQEVEGYFQPGFL